MFTLLMEALAQMFYFTGYIRSQSFAKPLSKEEEERCIALLAEKDREAREKLIEHNLRLVAHIVKKYDIKKTQTDDLISIGTIGLIKAVDTFDPLRTSKFSSYASRCIENELRMELRRIRREATQISLQEPLEGSDGQLTLADTLPDPAVMEDRCENRADAVHLRKLVEKLPPRERELLTMRYGLQGQKPCTQQEVAQKLGISRSYVSRIEKRALEVLSQQWSR